VINTKVNRVVDWVNGSPVVEVNGVLRPVKSVVSNGDNNMKTAKNNNEEYMSCGTSLAPEESSGTGNVCTNALHCPDTCLDQTGRGAKHFLGDVIHGARIARTVAWFQAREWFLDQQAREIEKFSEKAKKQGKKLCYRPNMFSDIKWEKYGVPQAHPDVQFYDYTKHPQRVGQVRKNYWTTFSRGGKFGDGTCIELLQEGKNVAVVFDDGYTSGARNLHKFNRTLPEEWNGFQVVNGDETDRRWEDPRGVVIGLRLKAPSKEFRQKALDSGFAVTGWW
jgi:hypothetical protein